MEILPESIQPIGQKECPQCKTILPIYHDYVTWCEQCNWNLEPPLPEWVKFFGLDKAESRFDAFLESRSKEYSQNLLTELKNVDLLQPSWTRNKILAYVIALFVHAVTLSFLSVALFLFYLTISSPDVVGTLIGGVVCLLIFFQLLPNWGKWPTKNILPVEKYPALYKLTNQVSRHLNIKSNHTLKLEWYFGAYFARLGLRRRAILGLGWPLLAVSTPQEKIALIAHELAHDVNNDISRGLFVGGAIATLLKWYEFSILVAKRMLVRYRQPVLITPRLVAGIYIAVLVGLTLMALLAFVLSGFSTTYVWLLSPLIGFFLLLLLLLSLSLGGFYLLSHLLYREMQRAEYLADVLSAEVAGTEAAVSLLNKHFFDRSLAELVRRLGIKTAAKEEYQDLFVEMQRLIAFAPHQELERVKRLSTSQTQRASFTHPPNAFRIVLLETHKVETPALTFSVEEIAQMEQELAVIEKEVQNKLFLYYANKFPEKRG